MGLISSLWMRLLVHVDHFFHRDLCVYLRRRETGMAEKFLYVSKVGAMVQQVRGKRMPERMGRDIVDIGTLFDVFIDHPADASCCDAGALVIQENGLVIAFDRRAAI